MQSEKSKIFQFTMNRNREWARSMKYDVYHNGL